MIVGVLLDTFVVRTALVPCVLSLGGWLNWWPRHMPTPATTPGETPAIHLRVDAVPPQFVVP